MFKKFILAFILIISLSLMLESCDIINSFTGDNSDTDNESGSDSDNGGEKDNSENKNDSSADISNSVEEHRAELKRHMQDHWAAVVAEFNYKILIEKDKKAFDDEYRVQLSRADTAKDIDAIDAIRVDFDRLTQSIFGNEIVKSYVKEEYKTTVMLGESFRAEVIKNLVGKTFCIEKTYTGVEEHIITADFIAAYEGEVFLNQYEALVGLPVSFEPEAYYGGIELKFDGTADVSALDAVLTYKIADANPLGWQSLTVYGETYVDSLGKTVINARYARLNNEKTVYYDGSDEAVVITHNGYEVFFIVDKDKSELKFERPSSDLMKTLTYEKDGTTYIFNIYGVLNSDVVAYKTTVDITYSNGKTERTTSYCYLGAYSNTENGFAFSLLGLERLAYTEDGVLKKIPDSPADEK